MNTSAVIASEQLNTNAVIASRHLNTNAVIASGTDIDDSTNVSGEEDTADWGNGRF